jgi:hypothetical protein
MEKIGKIKFFMGFLSWFASGRPVAQNTLVPVSNPSNSSQKYSECIKSMAKFYQPDLGASLNDPFARDETGALVRRGYWLDMGDSSIILLMKQGIGAHLTNDYKRAHLGDIGRDHLIDDICGQDILPPL